MSDFKYPLCGFNKYDNNTNSDNINCNYNNNNN